MAMGKAGKFFGLAVADLIKNACSTQNNGRLVASEWKVFWQTVKSNPKEATELLGELVERMMALLEPKAEKMGVSLETLANTIAFMTLFTEFKPGDGKIKGRLGAWKVKEKDPDYGRRFPQAKQIMVTLNMRAAKEDLVDRLLISAYTLGTADDFKALIDVAAVPTIDPDAWRMSEGSFSYPYLKRMCDGDRKTRDAILSATLTKLTSLPSLTTHRRAAEMQVLALFHMLRNFITLGPIYDRAFLAKATATLTTFFFWPMPYGGLAKELLMMIQKETIAPGAAFRARIANECKKGFLRGFASDDGQECRPCYMLMNEEDKIAQSFALTMDVVDIENKQAKKAQKTDAHSVSLAPATKIQMSLAMMRGDLGGELSDADYAQFAALSEADVNTVYRNLEGVLEWIPAQTPADAALEIRKKGFSEIKAKLKAYAKASADAKKPPAKQPKSPGADPELPPIVHFAISHKLSYKFTSKEEVEIMCLERLPFPEVPMMETFRNLLVEHDPNRTGLKQAELRFAITGSDRVLHNFLCAYFYTKLMAEASLTPFAFKFYILPAARNTVAAFLARHDAWYNRHVFLPFRTPNFIVPWLNCDEQGAPNDQEATSLHPPAAFYRCLVEDYLREAENTFHFQVYKLEGWTPADALAARAVAPGSKAGAAAAKKKDEKKDEKDPKAAAGEAAYDTLIPFMQRLEFGLSAHAERVRANAAATKNKIPDSVRTEELCRDKNVLSTYAPADVRLKFVPVDMKGAPRDNAGGSGTAAIEDDPNQFTALQLSAVPALGDKCFPPDPSQPWLELHAQPFKAVKVKGHRSTLFSEPKQHVNSVEIEAVGVGGATGGVAGGPRFDLLIDGQLFGPFYKVKITPHIDEKTKKQLTFPVQTFFDITNLYQ